MTAQSTMKQMYDLEARLFAARPPIRPEPQHWLCSDAGESYCYPCARKARAAELGIPVPPLTEDRFAKAESALEAQMSDGIDGGDWYSGESDGSAACATCGATLRYALTEYGVGQELAYFEETPHSPLNGEATYALSRIFTALCWSGADPITVERALKVGRAALSTPPKENDR